MIHSTSDTRKEDETYLSSIANMSVQVMYNLREKYQFCSGTDLHEFFLDHIGDPSPPGNHEIGKGESFSYVHNCCKAIESNSPSIDMRDCLAETYRWFRAMYNDQPE